MGLIANWPTRRPSRLHPVWSERTRPSETPAPARSAASCPAQAGRWRPRRRCTGGCSRRCRSTSAGALPSSTSGTSSPPSSAPPPARRPTPGRGCGSPGTTPTSSPASITTRLGIKARCFRFRWSILSCGGDHICPMKCQRRVLCLSALNLTVFLPMCYGPLIENGMRLHESSLL